MIINPATEVKVNLANNANVNTVTEVILEPTKDLKVEASVNVKIEPQFNVKQEWESNTQQCASPMHLPTKFPMKSEQNVPNPVTDPIGYVAMLTNMPAVPSPPHISSPYQSTPVHSPLVVVEENSQPENTSSQEIFGSASPKSPDKDTILPILLDNPPSNQIVTSMSLENVPTETIAISMSQDTLISENSETSSSFDKFPNTHIETSISIDDLLHKYSETTITISQSHEHSEIPMTCLSTESMTTPVALESIPPLVLSPTLSPEHTSVTTLMTQESPSLEPSEDEYGSDSSFDSGAGTPTMDEAMDIHNKPEKILPLVCSEILKNLSTENEL